MRILKIFLILILSFSLTLSFYSFVFALSSDNVNYNFDVQLWDLFISNNSSLSSYVPFLSFVSSDNFTHFLTSDNSSIPKLYANFNSNTNWLEFYNDSSFSSPASGYNFTIFKVSSSGINNGVSSTNRYYISFDSASAYPNIISLSFNENANVDFYIDYEDINPVPDLIPFTGEGITVPAGYCCVIDRAFNDIVSTETYSPLPDYAYLTCITNEKSPIIGDWVTGASYGYQNNLDLSNISSLNTINWIINPNKDKTGLFNNRSYNAFKEIISNTSSRYILICNPPYSNYSSENNTFVSPTITINFVNYDGSPYHGFCGWYKLYRYDSLNNHSYVISEDNPINWQGEINESGDGYTQQGWGDEYTTPAAQLGGYPISSSESSDNLISLISRYFGLGQEKVDQLSSQGQGFFSFLSNLYSWMPTEILTIVSSVFIIFLVVACIKLFL